jgi:hypothetical protein
MFCGECGAKVLTSMTPPPSAPVVAPTPPSAAVPPPPASQPTVSLTVPVMPIPAFNLPIPAPRQVAPVIPAELDEDFDETVISPRRHASWYLVAPDGTRHPIRSGTVIGRAPSLPLKRPTGDLLPLVDMTKSLSKTHAYLEPNGESLTIEDLASTNGVIVRAQDGGETEAMPGDRLALEPGSVVELGDYFLTVVRE